MRPIPLLVLGLLLALPAGAGEGFELHTRRQQRTTADTNAWETVQQTVRWDPAHTAVIVCDMWDRHWCRGATARVGEMAPRMNDVLTEARRRGATIIHAPSDTMTFYADSPQRKRAQAVPAATLPAQINEWRSLNEAREPRLPIDDADGGCDDEPACPQGGPWTREIAVLEVAPEDYVTDQGGEVYNILAHHGLTNVIVMGVHANMCVLGRPFSIRQMVSLGKNTVLMRDMTDTMYNSRSRPWVSHFTGTDLVVAHIERHWCPSITSADLLGGMPFRFAADRRKTIVFMVGENEYRTWESLPAFAHAELEWRGYGVRYVTATADYDSPERNAFTGAEALRDADLIVLSVRRRAPQRDVLALLRAHLDAGRPLVGIRTASHAFDTEVPDGDHAAWPDFDTAILGADYQNHHGNRDGTTVAALPGAALHPVLRGVATNAFTAATTLYRNRDLAPTVTPLLEGAAAGATEPVAWVNTNANRRVFYTSLGGPEDFQQPAVRRVLLNGILWCLGDPIPPATAELAGAAP